MSSPESTPPDPAPEVPPAVAAAVSVAEAAGLRYVDVTHLDAGIRRLGHNRRFRYVSPAGAVRDPDTLDRIRSLVIPPAWTDVWICPSPRGHIQAVGRDARGRKQYRYHPKWREVRDETKYGQLLSFGKALPAIRRRVRRDLARKGLPREKVLATVVELLDRTTMRIGNEEYARTNQSYGLTTLRNRHVSIRGSTLRFQFRGKSGKVHDVAVTDRRLARIVRTCQDIPGYELFQYHDEDGTTKVVESADINAYLREISGMDITAKVFRTWAGTVLAIAALRKVDPENAGKAALVAVIKDVARQLGNTPAVCRKGYVHPGILESYDTAEFYPLVTKLAARASSTRGLSADERLTMSFLAAWQKRRPRRGAARAPQELGEALAASLSARKRRSNRVA